MIEASLLPHQQHGLLHQLEGVGLAAEVAHPIAADARREVVEQGGEGDLVAMLGHPNEKRRQIAIWVVHGGRYPAWSRLWLASICHCAIP
ncbi:hypothetical protein D3C72_2136480 [compost metagenome]